MTSPTGVPAKIARLVTEAQGAIFKIAEAVALLHDYTPRFEGRYMHDPVESVWDRVGAALNEASGYGVALSLLVEARSSAVASLPPSKSVRIRADIPARISQLQEIYGPEKLIPIRIRKGDDK